jgi:hypothetical protein
MASSKKLTCETCGKEVEYLRRDVLDAGYNALAKPPTWNCDECYERKRRQRQEQPAS